LLHADAKLRFGPLEGVISTPAFHHAHHACDTPVGQNYASMLPLYDRLFGTYHVMRGWPQRYGLDTEGVPKGLLPELLYPFRPD
jgi:sterol desaturase/sphingolipid hydroxylase (fatty acid hydroxylase superfamily)